MIDANKEYRHNWVRCKQCRLVYANPAPEEDVLARLYTESDQGAYTYEVDNITRTYRKYLDRYGAHVTRRGRAVDVGAGAGFFLKALLDFGFEDVIGYEPSAKACASASPDVAPMLRNRSFSPDDLGPGSVDLVTCFQTLEHVYHPEKTIRSFADVLSPGGVVYAVAHNFGSWGVHLLGERHPIVNAGHLTLFDMSTLRRIFENLGFDVIDVFKVTNRYSVRYWTELLPLGETIKKPLAGFLKTVGAAAIPVSLSMGNMGIFARKG